MNVICFHNPDEENGYLSNWYLSHFTVKGIDFSSMEQFMMYQKACRFHDEKIANDILPTDDVAARRPTMPCASRNGTPFPTR